jgi:hypothetical protein
MTERRTSRRIPLTLRSSFAAISIPEGEGTIIDLSASGCRIASQTQIPVRTYLGLSIQVDPLILIDLASVRWAKSTEFGVEFHSLQPEHQARLEQLIEGTDSYRETS